MLKDFYLSCTIKIMRKVLVGGTFNVIHPGHIFFLGKAREYGDHLTVVVASDATVLREKGFLVFSSEERAEIVGNLKHVDDVVVGDEEDMMKVVEEERPDVIVLGYDQKFDVKGLESFLKEKGIKCKIVRIGQKYKDYSTSEIIRGIKEMEIDR